MSDLKMSERFSLPLKTKAVIDFCDEWGTSVSDNYGDFTFQAPDDICVDSTVGEINSHDSHVEQIAKLEREKEMLRAEMVMVPVVLSSYKNPPPKVKDMLARIGEALAATEPK